VPLRVWLNVKEETLVQDIGKKNATANYGKLGGRANQSKDR